MLHHVVKDEQCKLLPFGLLAAEAVGDYLAAQALHEPVHTLLMCLKEYAHQLSCGHLQVILIPVLLL